MQFHSFQYIIYLFGVTALYYLLPLRARKVLLLAASFAFYAAWNARYLLLMLAVIGITYAAARLIVRYPRWEKAVFTACLGAVLALLFYFKYLNFMLETVNALFHSRFVLWEILLPVGISFYVFQSLGYVIDVWHDRGACEKSLLNYALFISFFPQLVAGPIERSGNMLRQFNTLQKFQIENIKNGLTLILVGLVEKVVIADRLAVFVSGVFEGYQSAGRFTLALAAVFFAFQVYCDFGAYSHIAIGSARLMGYRLMQNFDHPYLSRSFAEYWSRWHISLSSWFQDYIFMPFVWANPLKRLGPRFAKPPVRIGLLLVFFVSGLWHGANWTFVVWGLLHAAFRIAETSTLKAKKRFFKKHPSLKKSAWFAAAEVLLVFALNSVTYVVFRADSLGRAADYLWRMLAGTQTEVLPIDAFGLARGELVLCVLLLLGLALCDLLGEKRHKGSSVDGIIDQKPVIGQSAIYAGLLLLLVVCGTYGASYVENPFVYFQF